MILIDGDGTRWGAHFRHVAEDVRIETPRKFGGEQWFRKTKRWETQCTIHVGPCKKEERVCRTPGTTGVAKCSLKDEFKKITGRKLAFARAIEPLPRGVRRQLWENYFEQRPRDKAV